jgi:hypothetical protein
VALGCEAKTPGRPGRALRFGSVRDGLDGLMLCTLDYEFLKTVE